MRSALAPTREEQMAHSQPNLILSRLSDSDFRLIKADLEDVDLPSARCWSGRSGASTASIFPRAVLLPSSPMARAGLSVLLGNERPKHQTYMQAPGKALEKLSNGTYAPAVYN
jgi:hypothetical protein